MKLDPGESQLISTRALHDCRVNEVFYPAGMRQDRHRHRFPALSFVASGQYQECIGSQSHSGGCHASFIIPPMKKHAVAFESDVRILSVEFRTNGNASGTADSLDRVPAIAASLSRG
jgi:quercetin dioxygenase-like cupin family protein